MNMNMGIRENIKKQIDLLGYGGNLSRFAKDKGLSNSHLNEILNGKKRYNEGWLKRVAVALGVDVEVLLSSGPVEIRPPVLKFNMPEGDYVPIKLFNDPVILGPGYDMRELRPEGHVAILKGHLPFGFSSNEDRVVCFPTTGISMKPTINPGSFVWIDRDVPREDVVEGGIYAFLSPDDGVTIKRLVALDEEHIVIDGDNPDREERALGSLKGFPLALKIPEPDGPPIIVGRVIWILNRLVEKPKI
jgi:transcriptional regulator with XRE-family HTH domain